MLHSSSIHASSEFPRSSSDQNSTSLGPKLKSPEPKSFKKKEGWRIQKEALNKKFTEGWAPRKRLSPDALEGIRQLHAQDPVKFSTAILAQEFKVSPEAIRRILKSKWRPDEKTMAERRERWRKRNARIWNQMAEIGLRPQRKEFSNLSDTKVLSQKPASDHHD